MNPSGSLAVLLPLGLAFIMFSLGLGLGLADFRRVLAQPRAVVAGMVGQVVVLPAIAFSIASGFQLGPEVATGLMILAACPGGVTAGLVTNLARGDTALSITLTALTSVVAFVTVPLVVGGSLVYFAGQAILIRLPAGQLAGGLFLLTVLPVAAGMALRQWGPGLRLERPVKRLATGVFLAIVIATFVNQWDTLVRHFPTVGPATLALNLLTMTAGYGIGRLQELPTASRIAMSMECGMQNSALGITLAVSLLGAPALAIPSVVYALLMNVTALAVILLARRDGFLVKDDPDNGTGSAGVSPRREA